MNASGALRLARHNLSRSRRGAALSALGVAVGTGCLLFFSALGAGVSDVVRTRVLPVDDTAVEVVTPRVSLGALLGGGALDEDALARLKALPGVADAYPKMDVRVSAISRYNGDFFGQPLRMGIEVMAVGVDPRLVEADVEPGRGFSDPGEGQPIPALANTRLLEIYNTTFAAQRGLPQLSASLLTGFQVPLEWGRSFVKPAGDRVESAHLELVGFSPRAMLAGVTVPLDVARRINRRHGEDFTTYSAVVLHATGADVLSTLTNDVRRMGFEIDDTDRKTAEQAAWAIAVVTTAFALLSALVTLLAAVNITHAFWAAVRERRREIGVLRSLGASQRDVLRVLLTEATLVGFAGALVGVFSGVAVSLVADALASRFLPPFPFKPDSFFLFSPGLFALALGVGIAAALLGALGPAQAAARLDPVAALAE